MNIDLHTHGKLSKKSTFSPDYFRGWSVRL